MLEISVRSRGVLPLFSSRRMFWTISGLSLKSPPDLVPIAFVFSLSE
jgi:hypothetical protein